MEKHITPNKSLWICMVGAVLVLAVRSSFGAETALDTLAVSGNDDIMRLLSIRDLLAGQSWFDMVQYRILPPDGLPMHWSRFVDLGIAGVIRGAELLLSAENAESVALWIWPLLIFTLLVLLCGSQVQRIFGTMTAAITVVALAVWPVTSFQYFRIARIDHHNLQILLATAMIITLIRPGAPSVLGVLGGAAGAASLTIGLETMPLVGLAGLTLALRAGRDPSFDSSQLLAFSGTLIAVAVLLFLAQTARSDWLVPYCDQLSPSMLAMLATAGVASLLLVAFVRRGALWVGVAFFATTIALGIGVSSPILLACLDGPYATLPDEVRVHMEKIVEVRPAHSFLKTNPAVFFQNAAPGIGAVIVAALAWAYRHRKGVTTTFETRAICTLLAFGTIAVAGTFIQIRIIVLTAPIVPMLMGYGLAVILSTRLRQPTALNATALIAAAAVTLFPPMMFQYGHAAYFRMVLGTEPPAVNLANDSCRRPDILRRLNDLAPGLILHPTNLGPPIVLLTHHDVLAGPYHRRPEAIVNGLVPFAANEAGFRAAIRDTEADYLVLCRGVTYGNPDNPSFASRLAKGEVPNGFSEIPDLDPNLVVLRPTDP